ncbi:DUF4158 domain-containing protein [Nocardia sp. NPDC050193]
MFLTDPVGVPAELVAYLAEQLEIDDPSCLGEYMVRRSARFEHQAEIEASYGLVPFGEAEAEPTGAAAGCDYARQAPSKEAGSLNPSVSTSSARAEDS